MCNYTKLQASVYGTLLLWRKVPESEVCRKARFGVWYQFPKQAFYTWQVGDANLDHQYWGRPEEMTMPRTCVTIGPGRPGSDVAGETAAALAAGAIVFKEKGGKKQLSLPFA